MMVPELFQFYLDGFAGCHGFVARHGEGNGLERVCVGRTDLAAVAGDDRFDEGTVTENACVAVLVVNNTVAACGECTVALDDEAALVILGFFGLFAVDLEGTENLELGSLVLGM